MVKYINRKTNKKKVINKKRKTNKTNKKQRKVKKGGDDVNILKDLKAEKENKKTIADTDKIFGIILGDKPEQVIAFKELLKYEDDFQKLTKPEFVDKKGNNIILAILNKKEYKTNNSLEMFKYLEDKLDTKTFKKLINTPNANGVTALMHSITMTNNIELFKKVLFYSADNIEAMKDTFDKNIFFAFANLFGVSINDEYKSLQLEKLQLLFDSIKDKNKIKEMLNKDAIDNAGYTPLDRFVSNNMTNNHDIVQLFIKYGAYANYITVRDTQMSEQLDIEYLLLKNGTSLSIDPKQSNLLLRIKIQRALVEESRIISSLDDGDDEDNIEATANTFKYEDKVKKIDGGYVFCADKDKNNAVKFDGLYLKDGVETIQYSSDKKSEDETPVSNFFMKYCYFFDGKEYHRINSYNTNISKPYEEATTCIKKSR